jgi:4-amino-4-deoxy-L-arabinose transferase-like glycosyltransferase
MYCANDRPFAFRLIALPFTFIFGPNSSALRASCFTCFILTLVYLVLTARQLHTIKTGLLAALLFMLSPEVLSSSVRFYVEACLYLSLAATLFFLFKYIDRHSPPLSSWISFGFFMGVGIISKTSYVMMIVPPLLFTFWISSQKWGYKRSLAAFTKPLILALFISIPWWALNFIPAWKHIQAAGTCSLVLEGHGLILIGNYFCVFLKCVTGFCSGIILVISAIAVISLMFIKKTSLPTDIKYKLEICLLCGTPLVVSQIISSNHCLRLVSPSLIPLAIMGAYFIIVLDQACKYNVLRLCIVFLAIQLGLILSSFRLKNEPFWNMWDNGAQKTFAFREQWDWEFLYKLLKPYRQETLRVGFIGIARPMNRYIMAYPWTVKNEGVYIDPVDRSPLIKKELDFILNEAMKYNVIVIISDYPFNYIPRFNLVNSRNFQVIRYFSENQDFRQPVTIKVGCLQETTLTIFIRIDTPRLEGALK